MRTCIHPILVCVLMVFPALSNAQSQTAPFTGTWTIDFRSPAEKRNKAECGTATFTLSQAGTKVVGDHTMATVRCGRLNEGGEGSVKGVVIGKTAVLVVTSGRNGQIVLGSATVQAGALYWKVTEEIKPGEPEGDSGLILPQGVLRREVP